LHKKDVISVNLWIDWLKEKNILVFIKDKITPPPPGSDLDSGAYILYMQTPFQLDMFWRLGKGFIGIDTTHNVTHYEDFLSFTIIVRDRWGHGM
jgi:hypothetical protein